MKGHPVPAPLLRHPLVLAHGLFGFDSIGIGPWKFRYFANLPGWLRSSGNRVLVTRAHPAGRIATRSGELMAQIDSAFGPEPVHLVGHSMGGLDCRHLITRAGMGCRVKSLTTLGTPHRGSVVADKASELARPNSQTRAFLRLVGWEPEVLTELSREGAARFNAQTPDHPGVFYQSVAGVFPNACRRDFLQLPHRVVTGPLLDRHEGPNDGMVGEDSARWGSASETWPGDHFNLVNWVNTSARWPGVNGCRLEDFARVLGRLRGAEDDDGAPRDDSAGTDGKAPPL